MRWVVLLRGVNVGGVRLTMEAVRSALTDVGFTDVRTVLASGNVILTGPDDAAAVTTRVETTLTETFGYTAKVVVIDRTALDEVVASYPFPDQPDHHSYVVFSTDGVSTAELAQITGPDSDRERSTLGPHRVLYWQVPRGDTLSSPIGKASASTTYKATTTTRNLRTLHKILAIPA